MPALNTRTVEGILAAVIVLLIKSSPYRTTQELGMILGSISLVLLLGLCVTEFRIWRRWVR